MIYTDEYNKYILTLYGLTNRNRQKAQRLFEEKSGFRVSIQKIGDDWRNAGFKTRGIDSLGGHRYGLTETMFRKLYNDCRGDTLMMADRSGYPERSLAQRCYVLRTKPLNPSKPSKKEKRDTDFLLDPRDIPQRF